MSFLSQEIIKQTSLAEAMTDSQTTMIVAAGSNVVTPPSIAAIAVSRSLTDLANAEHVKVISRSTDTFVIERAKGGTTARAHVEGELVLGLWSPEHFYEIQTYLTKIEKTLAKTVGRAVDCVIRTSHATLNEALKVEEMPSPSMYAYINSGIGFVNNHIYEGSNQTLLVTAAPSAGNSRIDMIHIDTDLVLKITAGAVATTGTQVAPTVTGLKLASILVASGTTTITNSLITDLRVFA